MLRCNILKSQFLNFFSKHISGLVLYVFKQVLFTQHCFNLFIAVCLKGWGLTVTLGVPKVKPEVTAHYGIFLTGRTLKGSLFGGWKPKSDLPSLVDMYIKKVILTTET